MTNTTKTTSTQYFVTSNNTPVHAFDFDMVSEIFAGSAAQTKIFASHDVAAAWVEDYLSSHSLPMVVPVSELDGYFNGAEKANRAEYDFQESRANLLKAFEREEIDLESIEFKPWIEKFETYDFMQQQNIERGARFHDQIVYCAVQMFVNGGLRFDVAWKRSWSEAFVISKEFNDWVETLKAEAKAG